jgi:RNA polymerase sigma-70 factor (ECF subfamily)
MTELTPIFERRRVATEDADLRRALQRFVEARLRDRTDSEDLVQETYLRLYDYRRTRSVADVGAFCFAIARNLIRDHVRHLRGAPAVADLSEEIACPAPRADEILAYRERVDVLIRALRAMPALRREVFTRRRLDGQPVAIIAADLDLSIAAVEKHVVRALADLRGALGRRGLAVGAYNDR